MNFFGGPCQTHVAKPGNRVFLTFDDGPFEESTPALLEFCEKEKVAATFFLVASRARAHSALSRALVAGGHSVGNHSLDHQYHHFFRDSSHLRTWITEAQKSLSEITGAAPIAFRSPAGVRTPKLRKALLECGLPLVHWNRRFFDAMIPWSSRSASRAAERAQAGDIFLLHDVPRSDSHAFLASLSVLVQGLRARGLEPSALRPEDVQV